MLPARRRSRFADGFDNEADLEGGVALGTGGDAGGAEAFREAWLEGNPAVELAYGGFLGGIGAVERGELALAVAADFKNRFHFYILQYFGKFLPINLIK